MMQWREPVAPGHIHIRPSIYQQSHDIDAATGGRIVKGCIPSGGMTVWSDTGSEKRLNNGRAASGSAVDQQNIASVSRSKDPDGHGVREIGWYP